jgi:hypothetical protein
VSAIGRRIIRRLCKKIVTESRLFYEGGRRKRKTLIGNPTDKFQAVRRVENYLALMKTETAPQPFPTALTTTISSLRKTAADNRMSASGRVIAITRLLQIEGFAVPRYWATEPVDSLIESVGITVVEKGPAISATRIRESARRQALTDITTAFEQDRGNGCFKSLSEVRLRLPEQEAPEPPPVSLGEIHHDAIEAFLASIKKKEEA